MSDVPFVTDALLAVARNTGTPEEPRWWWGLRFNMPWRNLLFLFPTTIITDDCKPESGPLLIRWHLLRLPGGRAIMLHCFLRSDNDRHFHDHPWGFRSLLLSPYREHIPRPATTQEGRKLFDAGWVPASDQKGFHRLHKRFSALNRPALWQHWVETVQPLTWTLVYHGPVERRWGFETEKGWIDWEQYTQFFRCGE